MSLNPVIIKRFNTLLENFIIYGGYPRVVISEDEEEKREVLKNLFNIYLLRDVRDILGLVDDYKIFNLIKALSLQIGNIISYQRLAEISQQTTFALKKYLNLLEKTYVVSLIKPFFTNKRTELVKNPKVYFFDPGLRNAVIGNFMHLDMRQEKGSLYENFIFNEFIKSNFSVKYWRTKSKAEVDFIIDDNLPVEVKSTISKAKTGKSLISFIEKYSPSKALIFNNNYFDKMKINSTEIHFLYHFLAASSIDKPDHLINPSL